MKKHSILSTVAVASVTTATLLLGGASAQAANVAEADWHYDSALKAKARRSSFSLFSFWGSSNKTRVRVRNTASVDSVGPHRVLVLSWERLLNADGQSAEGLPYVELCGGSENCVIRSGGSKSVNLEFGFSFWSYFFGIRPLVFAQNVPYKLQLLHNADMDGTAGALQNVKPFSALVNHFRGEYPENTLLLSSGDNYIPGPRYAAASDESLNNLLGLAGNGRADITFMNAMGYQASAVGNHDLDGGTGEFASIINEENGAAGEYYPGAQFPYLSSNLDFTPDANLAPLVGNNGDPAENMSNQVAAYTTVDVAGNRIGVVGATTPKLSQITSTGDISIKPADGDDINALAAEIQTSVDALRGAGINKIILLAHMQTISIERQLATLLNGVDIIVAGGSNTLLADSNDVLRDGDTAADTYPLLFNSPEGEPVLVVNTDGDYKYLGRLVSQFDLSGKILARRLDDSVNGAYASTSAVLDSVGNPAPNAEVVAVSDAVSAILAARDGNILGHSDVYLDGRRSQVRSQETNMGNLTADANLFAAQQFDPSVVVSLKNGGGIRDDIGYFSYPPGSTSNDDLEFFPTAPNPAANKAEGDVSQFDIQGTLRFNNGLTLITVTAADLQAIVEHGVANAGEGVTSGRFPQVGGMKFSWDPSLAGGSRVRSLAVLDANGDVADIVVQNGALVGDANRSFRMVTLDFLYKNCGDGYPLPGCQGEVSTPETVPANAVFLTEQGLAAGTSTFADAGSEQDAFAEYLLANYPNSGQPYSNAEVDADQDERIQNLSKRSDTVLP